MHSSAWPSSASDPWGNYSIQHGKDDNEMTQDDTDPSFQQNIQYLKWIAYGIIAPILIGVGVIGNILNLIVLTQPNLKGVMYSYLTWLAISDMMSLIFTIPTLLRFTGCHRHDYLSAFYHAHLELALVNAFMACSVFIVVAVTVDRYFSVSKPTKFKKVHTHARARMCIISSYVVSFIFYIPVCFYKDVQEEYYYTDDGRNGSSPELQVRYILVENFAISRTTAWMVYLWFKEILVRLGPTIVLTFLNIMIIIAFQKVVRKRKALLHTSRYSCTGSPGSRTTGSTNANDSSSNSGGGSGGGSLQEERRLFMLLIGIVIMFVVTMTPAAFLTLFMSSEKEKNFNFQVFRAFANNMEFVNYGMNFYLYCLCSSEIRCTFLRVFHLVKVPPLISKGAAAAVAAASAPVAPTPASGVGDDQATTTVVSKI